MFVKVVLGQSPEQVHFKVMLRKSPEHFIPTNSIQSYGTRFRETGCLSIPKVKNFGKKSFGYTCNVCVYGTSSLVISETYRDIPILNNC